MAVRKQAPTKEPEPAPMAEQEQAPAAEQDSRIEAALREQTQVLRDMLQKLKEIRRRLPPPTPPQGKAPKAKAPKAKVQSPPVRLKATSRKK